MPGLLKKNYYNEHHSAWIMREELLGNEWSRVRDLNPRPGDYELKNIERGVFPRSLV